MNFNNSNYVAHYTKLETLDKYILPTNKIKVSNIKNMNDPYENRKDWLDSDGCAYDKEIEQYHQIKKLRNVLSSSIKILATTGYEDRKDSIGISGNIYCRPRMWAQYGNNHQGACLIFNKEKLDKCFKTSPDIYKYISNKVEYLEWLEIINSDLTLSYEDTKELINNQERLLNKLFENYFLESRFFKKHFDWKDESEFRWLVLSKEETDLYIDFKDSLEAIILGCDVCHLKFERYKVSKIPVYYLQFMMGRYTCEKVN